MSLQFPDDFRHDLYTQVREAVILESQHAADWDENWKKHYDDLRKKGFPLHWNELRIKVSREKEAIRPEQILKWMFMREQGYSLRGIIPEDTEILRELVGV